MKSRFRVVLAAVLVTAGITTLAPAAHASTAPRTITSAREIASLRAELRAGTIGAHHGTLALCAKANLACDLEVLTTGKNSSTPLTSSSPFGYGPAELRSAYGLTHASPGHGTIAVIGAGAYPTLASDLAIYRSTFGLRDCTVESGCFRQVNYQGGAPFPATTDTRLKFGEEEIAVETALDVDMASASCPGCSIISVQVPLLDGFFGDPTHIHHAEADFATAVQTARNLGATAVSISYGYPDDAYSDTGKVARAMSQPGLALMASSGDGGFNGLHGIWPEDLSTVTSVGGTTLTPSHNARGWSESAWGGAGSSCSLDVPPAVGQPASVSAYCNGGRAASDVSAVANPRTGVAVYDSYAPYTGFPFGFFAVGGTSVASPFIAGVYASGGVSPDVLGPNTLYAASAKAFHDVTAGGNARAHECEALHISIAVCKAGVGWDGPTGLGTPAGLTAF